MYEKDASPEQIKNELDIQFGLHSYSISAVYRKIGLLKCGVNILDNEDRPGRPIDEQLLTRIDQIIEDEPFSPFPTVANSEKPDKVVAKLLEGRVGIMVDGTPFVLTVPTLFVESFQSAEDYYSRPYMVSMVRFLRFFSFFLKIKKLNHFRKFEFFQFSF